MSIGDNIRSFRKKAKLTQAQLADKCGVSTITIRQYESGKRTPSLSKIAVIANALNVPAQSIIGPLDIQHFATGADFVNAWDAARSSLNAQTTEHITTAHGADGTIRNSVIDNRTTETRIVSALDQLNEEGRAEAVKRVEELAEIPRYRKQETPPTDAAAPTDGKEK